MQLDMTRGSPSGLLIRFAMPLMLSSLLQQLYTLCDSMIVGRLLGTNAFAAIGSASYLHWFPLSMLLGVTAGFGVALSHRFGAKDDEGFRRFFASALLLSAAIGMIMTLAGVVLLKRLLTLLGTPAELMGYALRYMRVLWSALLVTAMLNMLTSALRSMGDSRTPFISLIVSTALNIVLDFLLIGALRMGVEGAALATVISQVAALAWCCMGAARTKMQPSKLHWRPRRRIVRELLRLGIPQLLSQGVIATGELAVLSAINSFGVVFVTGMTASRRYFSLFNVVGNGLEGALATYVGQNFGANEKRRIKRGTHVCIGMGVSSALVIGVLIFAFARPLIALFIPGAEAEALRIGVESLRAEVIFVFSLYLLCEYRAAIQGMGNAIVPMLSGFLELILRILAAWLMPLLFSGRGLYFTDAVTWAPTALMLIASYYALAHRKLKEE